METDDAGVKRVRYIPLPGNPRDLLRRAAESIVDLCADEGHDVDPGDCDCQECLLVAEIESFLT
jgi:hypothetical protein